MSVNFEDLEGNYQGILDGAILHLPDSSTSGQHFSGLVWVSRSNDVFLVQSKLRTTKHYRAASLCFIGKVKAHKVPREAWLE